VNHVLPDGNVRFPDVIDSVVSLLQPMIVIWQRFQTCMVH